MNKYFTINTHEKNLFDERPREFFRFKKVPLYSHNKYNYKTDWDRAKMEKPPYGYTFFLVFWTFLRRIIMCGHTQKKI